MEVDSNDVNSAILKINSDVNAINEWIRKVGMQLNPDKTQAIIIGSPYNLRKIGTIGNEIAKICVCDFEVPYSTTVKYLGYHFNETFTSKNHVNIISRNVNFALSKIRHCRRSVKEETKLQLVKGVICPMFDYASIIYHGFNIHGTGDDELRLNVLMNSCIRFICNLSMRDHVSMKYNKLELLNAKNRREMLICSFIYNFIRTRTPSYLSDIFILNNNNTRAGLDTKSLVMKKIGNTRDEHLFGFCAAKLWNEIPFDIRSSESKDVFMKKIKNYYLNKQMNVNTT